MLGVKERTVEKNGVGRSVSDRGGHWIQNVFLYAVTILHTESNNVKTIIKKYKMKCQEHWERIPESRSLKNVYLYK